MLRFAGFELDRQRAELRGPDGEAIKLRPKTLSMLTLFATQAGRVLSKQDLMEAIWPNVHVGDDSLFQCIRELRIALGDDRRQIIKLVSGHGYLFSAEVSEEPDTLAPEPSTLSPAPDPEPALADQARPTELPARARRFSWWAVSALAATACIILVGLGISIMRDVPPPITGLGLTTIAVTPITTADGNLAVTAADVTMRLSDGLAKIDNIRVAAPQANAAASATIKPDFVVSGELQKRDGAWELRARMTRVATDEIMWTAPMSLAADDSELSLQQSRLAAGVGEPLAQRINALINAEARPAGDPASAGRANVVIAQAMASIAQTSRERFAASEAMLTKALADDTDNVDLAVALAGLQLRGVQLVWYTPAESAAAEVNARAILERGLKHRPSYLPTLEAYCRFLNATNQFVESLVACARVLSFDPWSGVALYHIGLGQDQLGRFDEALAAFMQADRYDTPRTQRWTWRLGAGLTYLLMGRSEDALPWLQSSIAITPASGRPHMLLAAAYLDLGRTDEAKAAMQTAISMRPSSTLANVMLPQKNTSAAFIKASGWIWRAFVTAGLPER